MSFQIDKQKSRLGFSVKHMMIATVRGTFSDYEAELHINESDLSQSSVTARIATNSVETKDRLRDEYLRSSWFFDPNKYPHLVFQSTAVKVQGNKLTLTGKLTIRDTERALVLNGTFRRLGTGNEERMIFELASEIDREAYNLVFNGAVETVSVVVGKKVKLDLLIELDRA